MKRLEEHLVSIVGAVGIVFTVSYGIYVEMNVTAYIVA